MPEGKALPPERTIPAQHIAEGQLDSAGRNGETLAMKGRGPALAVSWDGMWTHWGARRGDKREDCWIWTAVVRETDGSRWVDFEVGDRSEGPFLRLYERLPEAGPYRSDACQVYLGWFPPERHVAGKGGAANWNQGLHPVWRGKLDRMMRRTKGTPRALRCWCILRPSSAGGNG